MIQARQLVEAGDPTGALSLYESYLNDHPNDAECLYCMGAALFDHGNLGVAFQMFQQSMRIAPEKAAPYNGIGRCLYAWHQHERAAEFYAKALERDPDYKFALSNMGTVLHSMGRHDEALEFYHRAIEIDPDSPDTLGNLGMVYMTNGDWENGWRCMHSHVGQPERPERFFGDAEMWIDGDFDRLVVYGEQGVGDEVYFAALLHELEGRDVVLETNPKLAGLFQRSFPWLKVRGTRYQTDKPWLADFSPTHKIPIASLPMHFWDKPDDCPRKPYLTACPERRKMARALLDDLPGRKIGLAWTGGFAKGAGYERQVDAQRLLEKLGVSPFTDGPDVTFISLQYKEPPLVPGIIHWPFMVETPDYDDTAALVAELDAVISVPTSVINLAGALGTPTWVLLPKTYHHWRYGINEAAHPWFGCVNVVHEPWDLKSVLEATDGTRELRAA
jgi:tetratricopeptide (TPR) repeat protein